MPIYHIYKDFFKFLDTLIAGEDPWLSYYHNYLKPHKAFLTSYWKKYIGFNIIQLKERVKSVKPAHYIHLRTLINSNNLEDIVEDTITRCRHFISPPIKPPIYLMVGFFSAEGFVIKAHQKWCIGLGLERYKSFNQLPLFLAHEYCHWLRRYYLGNYAEDSQNQELIVEELLFAEGLSTTFTHVIFPSHPLIEHLFLDRKQYNWLQQNEAEVKENLYGNLKLLPARAKYYLGYKIVKEFMEKYHQFSLADLIRIKVDELKIKIPNFRCD